VIALTEVLRQPLVPLLSDLQLASSIMRPQRSMHDGAAVGDRYHRMANRGGQRDDSEERRLIPIGAPSLGDSRV